MPPELAQWAVYLLNNELPHVSYGYVWNTWYTPPGGSAELVAARRDYHTWSHNKKGQLITGLCIPGITLYAPVPTAAQTSYSPLGDTLNTPDPTAAVFNAVSDPPEGISWPLVGVTALAAGGVIGLFWLALKGAGRASGKAGGLREPRARKRLRRAA